MAEPNAVYFPPDNKTDPEFMKAFEQVANGATLEVRQAAFARAQIHGQALPKVQWTHDDTGGRPRVTVRASVAPAGARDTVLTLRHELAPLVDAVATTPTSFLHGDWKMGNLGIGHDGRTILVDWTYCGAGPAHCCTRKITNSAGFVIATPISVVTFPRSRSSGGLVSSSQRT